MKRGKLIAVDTLQSLMQAFRFSFDGEVKGKTISFKLRAFPLHRDTTIIVTT